MHILNLRHLKASYLALVFLCLIYTLNTASVAPTWITNSNIQAGVVTICSGKAYLSGAGPYYKAYSPAFTVAPNVGVAVPTIDITPLPTSMDWKVNLPDSANTATLKISMNYISTQFQTFKVAYIAVASTLSYLKVDYVELYFSTTGIAAGSGYRISQSNFNLHITIDSTHTLSIIPYLSGLKIGATSNDYAFGLTFAKNTNTNIFYNATVQGTTKVTEIVSYILIYDLTLGEATQELFLDYQPITGSNNALTAPNLLYFNSNNLLAGVSQFKFTSGFSFSLDTTSLTLTIPTSGASFSSIVFSFWSFRKRTCPSPKIYYERNTNLCYDVCPTGYLGVNSGSVYYCQPCSTYMAYCSGCTSTTVCNQCQATFSVKADNSGCYCVAGKYLNVNTCSDCDASCATCNGGTANNCLTCSSTSTVLVGSTCQTCHTSCKTCTGVNSNQCASCNNGFVLSSGSCVSCDITCNTCSGPTSQNCLTCKNTTVYLNSNNACVSCPTACATCSSATVCLTCVSTKYLSGSNWCQACHSSCTTCNGPLNTNCLTCDQVNRTFTGGKCLCKTGAEDASGNCYIICDDIKCSQCLTTSSVCNTCKATFLLSGGVCSCPSTSYYSSSDVACHSCHGTCATCTGPASTQCSTCITSQNREFNSGTSSCDCKTAFYPSSSSNDCLACPSACVTCSSSSACLTCVTSKYLSASNWCQACHSTCKTCNGPLNSNCLTCNQITRTFSSGHCTCMSGAEDASGNCITLCTDDKCSQCPSDPAVCTVCVSNLQLSGNVCLCSSNQYYSSIDMTCFSCHSTCLTCSGPSLTECLTCSAALNRQFDASTSKCNCKNAFFHSISTNDCQPCPSACVTCSSDTVCLTCVSSKYLSASNWCENCHSTCLTCNGGLNSNCLTCDEVTRTFSSGSCVCKTGAEDANGNCITPVTPVTPAITCNDVKCNSCPSDANICTQCKSTLILSGNTCTCPSTSYYSAGNTACYVCHGTCATCSGPSSTQCLSCLSTQNRLLNSGTSSCDCKPNFTSSNSQLVCSQSGQSVCSAGYFYNSSATICQQICGDGLLFDLQCDDGNLDAGDGCDSTCKIETGYSCVNGSQTSPSICSYNGPINFTLIEAKKEQYSNTVSMEYKLSPQLKLYSQYPNFTSYLSASDPAFTINQALYSLDQKRLRLTFSYNQSITSKNFQLSYNPPQSPNTHSLVRSSYSWSPSVSNGLSLSFYDENTYQLAKIFDRLVMGLVIASLIVFGFGLFFRKMIGVDMILLMQIQVLSVTMMKEVHPYFIGLVNNDYVFGYNGLDDILGIKKYLKIEQSSPIFSTIGFSSVFGQNVNVMILIVVFVYILSAMIGIWSNFVQRSSTRKMKEASMVIARQIAFGLVMFSIINITASLILQINQSQILRNMPQFSGIFKILSLVLVLINFILYGITYKQSIESTKLYKRQSKLSQLQPLFVCTKTIIIAVLISLHHKVGPIIFYVLISVQSAYFLFVCVLRPFRRKLDLVRSLVVQLAMAYVIVVRWFMREYVNIDDPGEWQAFKQYGVMAEYGLVGLTLVMSIVALIYHVVKSNKADSRVHPQPDYDQLQKQSEPQKVSQKNSKQHQNSTHHSIEHYFQNQKQYKRHHLKKIKAQKNGSMAQLIQFSNDQLVEQIGHQSKRKLKDSQEQNKNRKETKKYYNGLEIMEMED